MSTKLNIKNGVLISKVWCVREELEQAGVDSGELFLPIAVDLSAIKVVKHCGSEEDQRDSEKYLANKAVIWLSGERSFILEDSYDDVLDAWIRSRTQHPVFLSN